METLKKKYKLDHKLNTKSDDSVWDLHAHDVDLKSNHIYLMGIEDYATGNDPDEVSEPGIEYIITNRFIRNLNLCMRVNPDKPIIIHMKTCGGDWSEGMAIYDTIKSCPNPITILSYTHARSMSSLIFLAANKRVMMPNSYFMFHDGEMGIYGTVKQVESAIDFSKDATETMMQIYVDAMKERGIMADKSDDQIYKWLRKQMDQKEDVYLPAKEAVEYGFADEIFDYDWSRLTEYNDKQLAR